MDECPGHMTVISRLSLFLKHPMITIILVGLIIRATLIPLFTYNYDISFWATTIQHTQSGNGLYNLDGCHYTPVWGYLMSFLGLVANFVFGITPYGTIAEELLPALGADWKFYGIMTVTPEFSILIKSFLTTFDFLCAYLIYTIVKRFGHSDMRAAVAFGLWFLSPIVIYTSTVQAAFDNISIALLLLTLLLVIDRRYFLAGMTFSTAALTKFFPGYLIFMLLVYILRKNKDRGSRIKAVACSVTGAALAAILILLPQIILGQIPETLGFVFNRVSVSDVEVESLWTAITENAMFVVLLLQPLIFGLLIYIAHRAYKTDEQKFEETFMLLLLLSATTVFLWTPTPTYILLAVPFLIYIVVTSEPKHQKRYFASLIFLFITTLIYSITMQSFSIFFQASVHMDLVPAEFILNGFEWMSHTIAPGITRQSLLNLITAAAETIAIYSIFLVYFINHLSSKKQGGTPSE